VVLARDGGRGLTHRAVDREAGVPQGATKNHFPTREALLEAAARRMAEQHRGAVQRLQETTPCSVTAEDVGELYPALLRRAVAADPTPILAMVELYLEAVRRPAVRAALGEMVVANAHAAAELHRAAGLATTTGDAGLLDAYFLGAAISVLALPAETRNIVGMDDPETVGHQVFAAAVPRMDRHRDHRDRATG
jgi:AcrR family transcriptional regulator